MIFNGAEIYLSPIQLLSDNDSILHIIQHNPVSQEVSPIIININKDSKSRKIFELNNKENFTEFELILLSHLSNGDKTIDEISELMNKKPFELIECISMLEIKNTTTVPDTKLSSYQRETQMNKGANLSPRVSFFHTNNNFISLD